VRGNITNESERQRLRRQWIYCGCPERFFLPFVHPIWHSWQTVCLIASLVLVTLAVSPLPASAWNIPGHMLSGIIAYQVLRQESPQTIDKGKAVLEKHPWYTNQWHERLRIVWQHLSQWVLLTRILAIRKNHSSARFTFLN